MGKVGLVVKAPDCRRRVNGEGWLGGESTGLSSKDPWGRVVYEV